MNTHMEINKYMLSNKNPQELFQQTNISTYLTEQSNPTFIKVRYTPSRDTGIGNRVFILKNTRQETGWDPPNDPNLIIDGYPLWAALWGWLDWQKKLKSSTTNRLQLHYCNYI